MPFRHSVANIEYRFAFQKDDITPFDGQAPPPRMTIGAMSMDLKQHVGMKVKAARLKRGLTQERLAELIEKTAESISNIERGHVLPPLDTLQSLAQRLDMPMGYFFEDMDERARPTTRNRMEMEHRLRSLAEELADGDLRLAVAVVEAIKAQRMS